MYTPAAFALDSPEAITRLLTDNPFATIVAITPDGLEASHLPLVYRPHEGRLLGHLARANPLAGVLAAGEPVLVMFQGPHAYVSPRAYQTPGAPTWNYLAAHVHGRAVALDDDETAALLTELTAHFDHGESRPGSLARLSDEQLAARRRAILGFSLVIDRIEAKAKLSQNRPQADREAVVAALRAAGSEALADWSEALAVSS